MAVEFEVLVSLDGEKWESARAVKAVAAGIPAPKPPGPASPQAVGPLDTSDATLASLLAVRETIPYAFLCEARTFSRIDPTDPVERMLRQFEEMIDRFAVQEIDTTRERNELAALRERAAGPLDRAAAGLFLDARMAKRHLMFRDPALKPVQRILFVHRHPFLPSHNYAQIVQPVWNNKCTGCHDQKDERGFNLAATCDAEGVPASFRTLITGG